MPKELPQQSSHSMLLQRYLRPDLPIIYFASLALLIGFSLSWIFATTIHISKRNFIFALSQGQTYTVVGDPTISANFIESVLKNYHSPAAGKGKVLFEDGVKYHIDPAFALAFFMQESTFGTQGVARVTHSLGNIRATDGYPNYEGYRYYASWDAGFEDWYKLINKLYVGQWGLSTVDQIIPIYAPADDNNDENAYIQNVKDAVNTWREGRIEVY